MLKWTFGADTGPFRKGLQEMRGEVEAFSHSAQHMIGAAFGGAAVALWIESMVSGLAKVQDLANRLGISAESVQRISYAAKLVGVDAEGAAKAMTFLVKNLALAENGSKKAADAVEYLGINLAEFKRLSPEDQMVELSRAYVESKDSGQALAATVALLGKAGAEMIPLLSQGPEKLKEQLDEAHVASNQVVQDMKDLEDEIEKIKNQSVPVFGWMVKAIETVAAAMGVAVGGMWGDLSSLFERSKIGFSELALAAKAALTGDMAGANVHYQAYKANDAGAIADSKANDAATKQSFDERYNEIWHPKDKSTTKRVGDPDEAETKKTLEKRAKLTEEIAKLEEEQRIRNLGLDEQIADAQERKNKLAEDSLGTDDAALEARLGMLKVEQELEKLRKEKHTADEKDYQAKMKAGDDLQKLRDENDKQDAANALDTMTPAQKAAELKKRQVALNKESVEAHWDGDEKLSLEKSLEAKKLQPEIDSTEKSMKSAADRAQKDLDKEKKNVGTIAAGSLAGIGAGGSANLLGPGANHLQTMVKLLQTIAENTTTTDTGESRKTPEPI